MTFRLCGGTKEQRAVIRQALADVNAILGTEFRALRSASLDYLIHISDKQFAKQKRSIVGFCEQFGTPGLLPDTALIALRETLSTGALYIVFLHELGHFFGLSHSPRGVMSGCSRVRSTPLTPHRRRLAVADLAIQLVKSRTSLIQ